MRESCAEKDKTVSKYVDTKPKSGPTQGSHNTWSTVVTPLTDPNKNKSALKYDLRVREALYIRRFNTGPNRGMNEDLGSYVRTNQWAPVFNGM